MAAAVRQSTKSTDTNDSAATSVATAAWGSTPVSGNPIVAFVTGQVGSGGSHFTSVKNGTGAGGATGSDTFTFIEEVVASVADGISIASFICQNPTQTNAITGNFGVSTSFRRITAIECSGCVTTGQPNNHHIGASGSFGTGTDAVTSGAATTTVDGCLILGFGYNETGGGVPSLGTGYSAVDNASFGAGDDWRSEYKVQSTQGSVAATFTTSAGTDSFGVAMVALEPSAGGPVTVGISGGAATGGLTSPTSAFSIGL